MTQADISQFKAACDYPGVLDEPTVEAALRRYLAALGIDRRVVRLRQGWRLEDHPSLCRNIEDILMDFSRRQDARAARAAIAASDARDAIAARKHRFATWCIQYGGWWSWQWDLSWITTTAIGARQLNKGSVLKWAEPLFEAFVAGAWMLYWTDEDLFWVAKPVLHRDPQPDTRRLHNDAGPALESDAGNLYFWHGVMVPAFVVVRPDWITVGHIKAETNAEVRRIMIERFGPKRYMAACGAALLHQDRFGKLWRMEHADDDPMLMVEVVNATPEPDGTRKTYFLDVSGAEADLGWLIRTARDAVAATFGFRGEEYAPYLET